MRPSRRSRPEEGNASFARSGKVVRPQRLMTRTLLAPLRQRLIQPFAAELAGVELVVVAAEGEEGTVVAALLDLAFGDHEDLVR